MFHFLKRLPKRLLVSEDPNVTTQHLVAVCTQEWKHIDDVCFELATRTGIGLSELVEGLIYDLAEDAGGGVLEIDITNYRIRHAQS